jgi:PAS domain S-box-containing protein
MAAVAPAVFCESVLLINSYHPGFSWSDGIVEGIRRELDESQRSVELYVEYLDTKRFPYEPESARMSALISLLQLKYQSNPPDLVMTTDDNALDFYLQHGHRLVPTVPVVFAGVNHPERHRIAGNPMVTGVTEVSNHEAAVELIRKIHPGVSTIYVITDGTTSGRGNLKKLQDIAATWNDELEFTFITADSVVTFEGLLLKLRDLPEDSVVLHRDFFVDATGDYLEPERLMSLVSAAAPVPVYSFGDMYLGHGIAGGIITSSFEHGREAAKLAGHILNGIPPSGIPIHSDDLGRPMFDFEQLRKFSIPLSDLPIDSEIVGRPPSIYRDYSTPFWVAAVTIVLLAALSVFLAINVRRLRNVREQSARTQHYLEATLSSMGEGLITVDDGGHVIEMNRAAEELTGFSLDDAAGRRASTILQYYDDRRGTDMDGLFERVVQLEVPVRPSNGEFLTPRDGSGRRLTYCGSPIQAPGNGALGVVLTLRDVTDGQAIVEELEKSEKRLVRSQSVAHVGSWEYDLGSDTLWASAEFFRILGLDHRQSEINASLVTALVARDDRIRLRRGIKRLSTRNETLDVELSVIRASDHEVRFLNTRGELSSAGDARVVGTIQDITDSKITRAQLEDSLDEKEVLLREVHHRVKNNMQVISSLINLQQGHVPAKSLNDALMDSQNRIRSMALIHEILYQSETFTEVDLEPYLRSLCVTLFDAYNTGAKGIRMDFQTESAAVDIDRAIPCGLMANEILSNSLKYAFDGTDGGTVFLGIHRHHGRIILNIGDDGRGLPDGVDFERGSGLGMQLIRTLADQLNAEVELGRGAGTTYRIAFSE